MKEHEGHHQKVEEMGHHSDITMNRTGHSSNIDERTRGKHVREAAKRLRPTLKELQEYPASTGYSLHVTILYSSLVWAMAT